jgi:hypothetical protein
MPHLCSELFDTLLGSCQLGIQCCHSAPQLMKLLLHHLQL